VLGLDRYLELDERYAFDAIVASLRMAQDEGRLRVDSPETLARLLLGALTRAGILIAHAADPQATPGRRVAQPPRAARRAHPRGARVTTTRR
jgi:hypothetical protein